ncbi:amidohydrolase [Lacisediminimonas sp.]|uniref:amidohydrolase family protein n=1 Tax=Lacisediminimonas sp. TaxID=3060582 RepID=UPI0027281FBA|nr:amidohydrolase family protein [Lacisediminimonas sp.]MDO8299693.1 amidohydrolase family protein [Lacisediminimonas sp.]
MHDPSGQPTDQFCLAPHPHSAPPAFAIPELACDTHAHVVAGKPGDYPMSPQRSYTPPPAPEGEYLRMLDATGMARGVLVQISVYGTDNRLMLESLRRHPQRLRGVAVVAPDVSDTELADLHAAGVRGLRLNILFGGGVSLDAMERLAQRIGKSGWHLQLLLDARMLPGLMPRLTRLPCPVVIDHMGHMPVADGLDAPGFNSLRTLLREHDCWVKLSGAYRISDDFPDFGDVVPLAHSLIAAAPDRCVWGSDWPHVALKQMPDTGRLLNALPAWSPDPAQLQRILVDNPARLYGF